MYSLQREDKSGRIRTLHRNVLLPIGSLLVKADDKSSQAKSLPKATPRKLKPKPQPRKRTMQKKRINKEEESYHKPADARDSDDSITYVKQVYEEEKASTQLSGEDRSTEVQDTEDAPPLNEEVEMSRSEENEESEITEENDETETVEEREANQADNTAPVQHSHSDTDTNVKLPSRPTQTRRKPIWMREDQYILSMKTSKSDWECRVCYLQNILTKDLPEAIQMKITESILAIIRN